MPHRCNLISPTPTLVCTSTPRIASFSRSTGAEGTVVACAATPSAGSSATVMTIFGGNAYWSAADFQGVTGLISFESVRQSVTERSMEEDTLKNEYVHHAALRRWIAADPRAPWEALNQRV
jgi:hypothetical protein